MKDISLWIMLATVILICTVTWLLWPANADFKTQLKRPLQQFNEMAK